jgi:hypothetical protein
MRNKTQAGLPEIQLTEGHTHLFLILAQYVAKLLHFLLLARFLIQLGVLDLDCFLEDAILTLQLQQLGFGLKERKGDIPWSWSRK